MDAGSTADWWRVGDNSTRPAFRLPRLRFILPLVAVAVIAAVPSWRTHERDALALGRMAVERIDDDSRPAKPPKKAVPGEYEDLVAHGREKRVLSAARAQLGTKYVLGVAPRHAWSLDHVGERWNPLGFDCSTLVAYAFVEGAGIWPGGEVAHTDEIWTQGRKLPLDYSSRKTSKILRGSGSAAPPGGYKPGDMLFRRSGAGGWWGHVALVSEHGYVIEALPPDVHETRTIDEFLADGERLGWMRMREVSS